MKRSDLLAGVTPAGLEMTDLDLLRVLLASGVVQRTVVQRTVPKRQAEADPEMTKRQKEYQERLRLEKEQHALECRWVGERLMADIAALGGGPVVLKVSEQYGEFTVRMLQWQANGMGIEVDHVLKPNRPGYGEAMEEAKLCKQASARFAKLLQRQAEMARDLGTPRPIRPEEIDLTRFTIDRPLAAMMTLAFGDEAGPLLRRAMAGNKERLVDSHSWNGDRRLVDAGVSGNEVSWGRDTVRGAFNAGGDGVHLNWSKGSLGIFGVDLPDTVWMGCTGQRLGSLVEHPLFDGDMVITAVHATREKGAAQGQARQGWTLTLKNVAGPMPAGW